MLIPHGFDLQIPDSWWYWTPLPKFIGYSCIFTVQILHPFFLGTFLFIIELEEWFDIFCIGVPYQECVWAFLLDSLSLIRHSYCISSVSSKQADVDKITYLKILTFKYFSLREHSASLDLVFLGRPFRAERSPGFLTQRITVTQGLLPPRASCHAFQLGETGWLAP